MSESTQVEIGTREDTEPDEPGAAVAHADEVSSVDALMMRAMERGEDAVDALERLIALRERVEEREARKAFFAALGEFQTECPEIMKDKDGLQTRSGAVVSHYAPLDRIVRVAGPLLREHGFSWHWNGTLEDGKQHIDCVLTHKLGHSEVARFTAPVEKISKLTSGAQDSAGATTYGRRQSFVMVTGIVTAEVDNDGAPPPVETIGEKEAADIDALIDEVGADRAKFLEWLGVGSVADIPKARHNEVVKALERKRRQS